MNCEYCGGQLVFLCLGFSETGRYCFECKRRQGSNKFYDDATGTVKTISDEADPHEQ